MYTNEQLARDYIVYHAIKGTSTDGLRKKQKHAETIRNIKQNIAEHFKTYDTIEGMAEIDMEIPDAVKRSLERILTCGVGEAARLAEERSQAKLPAPQTPKSDSDSGYPSYGKRWVSAERSSKTHS